MKEMLLKKKEDGYAAFTVFFALIITFVLTILIYSLLTTSMLMSHQHEVDDVLADAVLAAATVDRTGYYIAREDEDPEEKLAELKFLDTRGSYNQFVSCIRTEVDYSNSRFFEDLIIEDLTLYEVNDNTGVITITEFNRLGEKNVTTGTKGVTLSKTGAEIKRTSVYGKISFTVHAYFMFDVSKRVSRELYSTIKTDDIKKYIDHNFEIE